MARRIWIAVLAAVALSVCALPAAADGELILYDGNVVTAPGGLQLGRWGSGAAEASTEATYVGPEVIRLSTHGLYAGGVLQFTKGVDLGSLASQQDAYIEMRIQPFFRKEVEVQQPAGAPGATPAPAAPPRPQRNRLDTNMNDDDDDQGPAPSAAPTQTTVPKVTQQALLLDHFRVVLKTDKGYAVLPWWPANPAAKDEHGWPRVDFPLRGFTGELGSRIEEIAIFGDKPDRFYVGRILVTTNSIPMQVTVNAYPPAQAEVGQQVTLIATIQPGPADPEVRWDFNMGFVMAPDDPNYAKEFDAKFKVSTTGTRVTTIFSQPGDYVVGFMVVDKGGAKPPVRRTLALTIKEKPKSTEAGPAS